MSELGERSRTKAELNARTEKTPKIKTKRKSGVRKPLVPPQEKIYNDLETLNKLLGINNMDIEDLGKPINPEEQEKRTKDRLTEQDKIYYTKRSNNEEITKEWKDYARKRGL